MLTFIDGIPMCEACCRAYAADPRGHWPPAKFERIHEDHRRAA